MSGAIAKPVLRGFLKRNIRFHLCGALVTSLSAGLLMKLFYADPRKRRHEEFYKTYDPEKQLKIMNESGYMQSCPK